MEASVLLMRLILGGVFLMSALTKLSAPSEFVANVRNYHVLPNRLAVGYAYVLPYAELSVGVLLPLGFFSKLASGVSIAMLISFMTAVGIAMARRQHHDCSCFGLLYKERVGWMTMARDGVLLALASIVFVADDGALTLSYLLANASRPVYSLALLAILATFSFSALVGYLNIRQHRRRTALHSHTEVPTLDI